MKIERPKSVQPMPENAKLVFKGVIFDTYQWEQEMFDGSKETFEKLKRSDTVATIPITRDGKVILLDEEQPGKAKWFLSVPAGRMEEGEEPMEAAGRELLEETGYEAKEFVLWEASQPVSKVDWAIYLFVAKGCEKVGDAELDAGEKISVRLVGFEEFMDRLENGDPEGVHEILKILRGKIDPAKKEEMRKLLFGE